MKKKFKKAIIGILIIIFIGILGVIGFNKLFYTEYNSLNNMDKNMINQLSKIYETYNNKSQYIWREGYTFNNIPMVLTPVSKEKGVLHGYSYVIGVDKLKNSVFSKEIKVPKEMNLPPIYRVSSLSPSLIYSWMPIKFTFNNIGNENVAFFKYNPKNLQLSNNNRAFKYSLMHELFHEYRQVAVWKNVNKLRSSIYVEERNKEQYQLLLTELAILDKACITTNKEELLNILGDFVTVRDARYKKFDYMKQEKEVETLEGCAQYIEYKYSKQVGEEFKIPFDVNGEKRKFSDVFNKKALENLIKKTSLNAFMDKNLYYYVGSLEGLLLDKLNINWKNRVEQNELIYDILKDEVDKRVINNRKSLENIKNEYGYNKFLDESQILVNNFK